jgi:hypothetical protein
MKHKQKRNKTVKSKEQDQPKLQNNSNFYFGILSNSPITKDDQPILSKQRNQDKNKISSINTNTKSSIDTCDIIIQKKTSHFCIGFIIL